MSSDLDQAVESAARSMFISMCWTRAVVEPEGQRKSQAQYEVIMGKYWDSGTAGESNYKGFRELAAKAVRAATNGILADASPEFVKRAPLTLRPDNSGIDPRFGAFLPPVETNKNHALRATTAYRTGWLARPTAQVVAYL